MTERFPEQRNRSAQRRADANQVPASAPSDATFPKDAAFLYNEVVFDEAFVAAAEVREPSARARAYQAGAEGFGPGRDDQHHDEPRRDGPWSGLQPLPHWSVRPSHHLAAVRLSAVAAITCVISTVALLVILLR
jgi:hypothetical protein